MLPVDELRPEIRQEQAKPYRPGQFRPGQSGNPGGRPAIARDLRKQLEPHGKAMVSALIDAMKSEDERVKLEAIKLGLAYLYGKPSEAPPPAEAAPGALMSPEEAEAVLCQ